MLYQQLVVTDNLPKSLVQTAIKISVLLQGLQASGETTSRGKRKKREGESVGDLTQHSKLLENTYMLIFILSLWKSKTTFPDRRNAQECEM